MVDHRGVFGALSTNLSKTFDCIPHDLFFAKLEAYGFQTDALNLVHDCLSNKKHRKQKIKINETFSYWKDIEYGVSQRFILSPLLFNIHLCDVLYFFEDLDIAIMQMTQLYIQLKKTKSLLSIH